MTNEHKRKIKSLRNKLAYAVENMQREVDYMRDNIDNYNSLERRREINKIVERFDWLMDQYLELKDLSAGERDSA